ncbi:MAG: hypothetical protein JWN71_1621 [Xanthobacteraceae bacterium]|jgi:hypothetical protein|nr:hypothetical protein [Xanthobacteraceae bacterium]
MLHAALIEEEGCPISDDLLGQVYRAGPQGLDGLVADISSLQRSQLALFCYGRAHLRELGLAVAACCDQQSLVQVAGRLGHVLYAQSRQRPEPVKFTGGRAKISLAMPTVASPPLAMFDDDDIDVTEVAELSDANEMPAKTKELVES